MPWRRMHDEKIQSAVLRTGVLVSLETVLPLPHLCRAGLPALLNHVRLVRQCSLLRVVCSPRVPFYSCPTAESTLVHIADLCYR